MTSSPSRLSVRTQIFLLVLAILLPVAAMLAWLLAADADRAREAAHERIRILSDNVADDVGRYLRQAEATLGRLAARPLVRALDPLRCDPIIAEYVRLHPEFTTLGLRDLQGKVICSYLPNPIPQLDPREFPWFVEGLRSGRFTAGDAHLGRQTGRWVSVLTHPVRNDSGEPIGLLVLPIDLRKLGEQLLAAVPQGAVVTVVDRNGTILLRSADAAAFIGKAAPANAEDATRGVREGFLSTTGADGVQRLYAFVTLPEPGWRVVAGVSEAAAYAKYRTTLLRAFGIGLAVLLLALALAWRIGAAIVSPITALSGAAARIAGGDSAARAAVAGPAEIESVAQQFNRMLDARDRSEAALRASEENYRQIVETAAEGIWRIDAGSITTFVNAKMAEMLGYTVAEMLGASMFAFMDESARAIAERNVERRREGIAEGHEFRLRRKDGSEIWTEMNAAPLHDAAGNYAGALAMVVDVTEQRRIQEETRQLKDRLAATLEAVPDLLFQMGLDGRYYEYHSPRTDLLAIPPSEFLGRTVSEVLPPEAAAAVLAALREAHEKGVSFGRQIRLDLPQGESWFELSVSRQPLPEGREPRFIVMSRDITARKLAENALRESEENLAITLQSIGDGVIATDSGGLIVRMNPAAERLTGWTLAQAAGRPLGEVFRLIDARTRAPVIDPVAQALAHGDVISLSAHTALVSRDGAEYQVTDSAAPIRDRSGRVAGVVLVFIDITEQYRARQAVEESEQRLRNLMANLPGYAYRVANDPEFTAEYVSEGVIAITGHAPGEYLARGAITRGAQMHPEDRARVWQLVQEAVAARRPYQCEYRICAKSGETKWVWERGRGVHAPAGELLALEGFVTDITDRKRAEEIRASLELQLRESQKMEAIGTLAGGIAHDFNNIIGTILGNAELARHDSGANPRLLESLEEVRKAGHRARDLVQQILSFSRRHPVERRVIELARVVSEAVRLLRAMLPAGVQVEWVAAADAAPVLADPMQMQQVLLNLGVNAAQAMRGRPGRINIAVEPCTLTDVPAQPLTDALPPGPYVRVSVSDTGHGMDEATRMRIFEPFFTTKPLGEGTGLGLSVVHGIVRAHQGAIGVESALGKGSRFDIYFPAAQGALVEAPSAPVQPAAVEGRGQHVLYLDDDEALVFLVTRLLQRRGYRVSGYCDQNAALAALRADPAGVDLVVTDYNMPRMSGLDVARAIREMRPDLPIAVASGFITEELKAQAAETGVGNLIFKANAVEEFCDVVQRLVAAAVA